MLRVSVLWLSAAVIALATPCRADVKVRPIAITEENIQMALMLVRSAVIALDQANLTGNYAVFHAMTVPALRERFLPADYAEYYAPMRRAKVDLGPALISPATFDRTPYLDENGYLTLEGSLKTKPAGTSFRLVMGKWQDRWLIVSLDLNGYSKLMAAAQAPVQQAPSTAPAETAAPANPAASAAPSGVFVGTPAALAAMTTTDSSPADAPKKPKRTEARPTSSAWTASRQ